MNRNSQKTREPFICTIIFGIFLIVFGTQEGFGVKNKTALLDLERSEFCVEDTNKKKKKKRKKKKRLTEEIESGGSADEWVNDDEIEDFDHTDEISEESESEANTEPTPEEIKARQDSIRRTRRNPRDSVPPAPMSNAELKTALSEKKYRRGDLGKYEAMKRRLEELRELRDKSAWLVKQQRWELNDAALKKSMQTAYQIRQSYSILENEIREIEEKRGKAAMHKFRHLVVDNIYDVKTRRVNREVLKELKENLFFSKEDPQILCQGGVGRILGDFVGKYDGAQGCRGYVSSLSNNPEFNLIIMELDDGTRLAVIIDKNADSGSTGALGVF